MSFLSIRSMALPPEDELLVCAARGSIDASISDRIREICAGEPDWDRVVDAAHRHGVASLLQRSLADVASDCVPRQTLDRLGAGFARTAAFNLQSTGALVEILDLLAERGIPALPFKGPVLAAMAYGNLALRQFADIDLLVPASRLWEVDDIVRGCGYLREGAGDVETGGTLPSEGQFLYRQESGRVMIELHWELAQRFYSFPFTFDELWRRRMSVQVGGRHLETFGIEDTIVTLALHHTKHRWERLVWICDFAWLLAARTEQEWTNALAHAAGVGAVRSVLLGLYLAVVVSGATIASSLRARIENDQEVEELARQVIEAIVRGRGEGTDIGERIGFNIQARERLFDRLRVGWRRALVPTITDRAIVRLPRSIEGLYYLVRPLRILLDRMKSIARGRS